MCEGTYRRSEVDRCAIAASLPEKCRDTSFELRFFPKLTFPDDKHAPSKATKIVHHPPIATTIPQNFVDPIDRIRLWDAPATRTRVAVPKTAMDEDDLAPRWKDNIGRAGKRRIAGPRPKP